MYLDNFSDNEDIIRDYGAPEDALDGATVHLAWYGYGSYEGSSLVIFEKDGKLYEVNGGHCSCYGLEGQWKPEETTWAAIAMRDYYMSSYGGGGQAGECIADLVKKQIIKAEVIAAIVPELTGRFFREEESN